MKKNMFLVQSFVTLAAFSATQILAMSKETTQIPQGFVERKDSQPLTKKSKKNRKKADQPAEAKKETANLPAAEATLTPAEPVIETATTPEMPAIAPEATPAVELAAKSTEPTIETITTPEAPAALSTEPTIETATTPETSAAQKSEKIVTEDDARAQMVKIFAQIQEVVAQIEAKKDEASEKSAEMNLLDQLAQSVYNPTPETKQGLGWTDWIKSSVSPQWFVLDAIKAKTFDAENADHMKKLMNAAQKLVLNGDLAGLMDLVDACRENYPNIELKRKVALQIQKRFDTHEVGMVEEYKNSIASENKKLQTAQQAMLDKTSALLTTLQKQLEENAAELSRAQISYVTATNIIAEKQNQQIKNIRTSHGNLDKLRRDLSASAAYPSEHLNAIKSIDGMHESSKQALDHLNNVDAQIQIALSLLPSTEKTAIISADNK